ncbi:hypothetical protein MHU86_19577 [Fragilaria crotonensis]|nr:hypothetical protein MHU86_19577 [Fragilaria crotonensis]
MQSTCLVANSNSNSNSNLNENTPGWGAMTLIRIPCGAWVGEYTGELLTRDQVFVRYWNTDHYKNTNEDDDDDGNDDNHDDGWLENMKQLQQDDIEWIESRIQRNQGLSGDYLFDVGDDYFLDGEDSDVSGWCRFINHAEQGCYGCNLETRCSREVWNGQCIVPPRLWFVAQREIAPGEELLFDYGDNYWQRS